jgi:hypothetical protein
MKSVVITLLALCVIWSSHTFAAGEENPKTGVYFDRYAYAIGQRVTVTIVDKNLDRHHDAVDSHRHGRGFVTIEINDKTVSDSFAAKIFRTSFRETGANTGIFKALLKIPDSDQYGNTIKGKEIRINYFDLHNRVIWHDTAIVR